MKLKLKRKSKLVVKESPIRKLTAEERERAIKDRLGSIAEDFIRGEILKAYENGGKSEAIKVCKHLCSNGGSAGGGFWVDGTPKGIQVRVYKDSRYINSENLVAEELIPYSEVVEYVLNEKKNGEKMGMKKNNKYIEVITTNNNYLFNTSINSKGKEVHELAWENVKLVNPITNQVISHDVRPKFVGWNYEDYIEQHKKDQSVRYIEPMSAHEDSEYFDREPFNYELAELKRDGHRALIFIGREANRVFSRRVSKKTGWFNENTDQVPHIRDLDLHELEGTVLDGEFDFGTNSMAVQSVMGALPENAIQYQAKNDWIRFYGFDILYYKGINIQKMSLWKRKYYLAKAIRAITKKYPFCYIEMLPMYVTPVVSNLLETRWRKYADDKEVVDFLLKHVELINSYKDKFFEVVKEGKEGLMIKPLGGIYEQKRSKNYVKLKKHETWDVFITGLEPPTMEYEGKLLEENRIREWKYWYDPADDEKIEVKVEEGEVADGYLVENCIPVSKPFFMGWCGGIRFGVWKDGQVFEVGTCKGLTEEIMEDLKQNGEKYIKEKRVFEVLAQEIIDKKKGSLRHPRFMKWRDDKSHEQCTFEAHIREVK